MEHLEGNPSFPAPLTFGPAEPNPHSWQKLSRLSQDPGRRRAAVWAQGNMEAGLSNVADITADKARAFQLDFTWVPGFGRNLHPHESG